MDTIDRQAGAEGENLKPYAGRWVVLRGGQVVGQGGTPDQALHAAQAAFPKEAFKARYVSLLAPLPLNERLAEIAAVLPAHIQAFLIGGAVRDAMLGKPTHDLDFVLSGEALSTARRVAGRFGGAYYTLDAERKIGRVIRFGANGEREFWDFAALRGPDLEADLRARDFTVNAMALGLDAQQSLYDPAGGALDLSQHLLRACSPTSLEDDPVRILRGIRLAAGLKFRIHPETRRMMRKAVPLLANASRERVRDELFRILDGPQPAACIQALDILEAVGQVLPELTSLKGVEQSPPHINDVWLHTLDVLRKLGTLLDVLAPEFNEEAAGNWALGLLSLRLGRYRQQIHQHLAATQLNLDRPLRGLLFLAGLYHDIAKPMTRQEYEGGRIRFFDHDLLGAKIALQRAREMRLSNHECERLERIVRHHMRPLLLAQSGTLPSRRAVYRFFRDCGPVGVDICILSLADTLATYGPGLPEEVWIRQVDTVRRLLEAWWEQPEEAVNPPSWISGDELQEMFGLSPGPLIGELLEGVREAQAEGVVTDREQALNWVRARLAQSG